MKLKYNTVEELVEARPLLPTTKKFPKSFWSSRPEIWNQPWKQSMQPWKAVLT